MEENYVYPAIFKKEEDSMINITFPGFPELMLCAESWEKGIELAQRGLALAIIEYLDSGQTLPSISPPESIDTTQGEQIVYIQLWLPYFRSDVREVYVKKSVTIPQWLDTLAKNSGINFSAALVKGIKEELGIREKKNL